MGSGHHRVQDLDAFMAGPPSVRTRMTAELTAALLDINLGAKPARHRE